MNTTDPKANGTLANIGRTEATEQIRYARPPTIPGAEQLIVKNSPRRWRVFHETYNICTGNFGGSEWNYRKKNHRMLPGGAMLLEPGDSHATTRLLAPSDFNVIFINPTVFERTAEELGFDGTPHFRIAQDYNPETFLAFERLHAAITLGESALEQQSRLLCCLRLLFSYAMERSRPVDDGIKNDNRAALHRAEAYLRARYSESVSLDEVARVAGLSRFYLLRAFTKQFSITPHAYQTHIRVTRAKDLISMGASITSAAVAVGFSDQSHFTRHFKKVLGVTPSRYIAMLGGKSF